MALSPIAPQSNVSNPPPANAAAESGVAEARGEAQTDQVSLGERVSELRLRLMIVEQTLSHIESGTFKSPENLFAATGKAEFEAKAAQSTDTSSEATAGRILEGITGYIFAAFELTHPDMTEEDLETFREQVMKGFEQGLEEAREIIGALGAMSPELTDGIAQTESLVREGLDDFFAAKFEEIRGQSQ